MLIFRHTRWVAHVGIATIIFAAATLAVGVGPVAAHEEHGHPARIHQGSCNDLRASSFTLIGAGAEETPDNEPIPQGEIVGEEPAVGIAGSVTMVDATLDDIVAEQHAIMVYESDEAMDVAIVCGDISGQMFGDDLVIGLRELNNSGFAGIALLRDEGEQTQVSLFLSEGLFGDVSGDAHDHDEDEADHDDDHN